MALAQDFLGRRKVLHEMVLFNQFRALLPFFFFLLRRKREIPEGK